MTTLRHVLTPFQLDLLEDELSRAELAYLDLETQTDREEGESHEDWHPSSRITALGVSLTEGQSWVVPLAHPRAEWRGEWREVAKRLFEAMPGRIAAHNGKFDVRWAYTTTGVDLTEHLAWDTMIAAYVLDENEPKGLKHLAVERLGVPDWSEEIDVRYTDREPWEKVAEYLGRDTDYGLRLMRLQREDLADEPGLARVYALLMLPVARALLRIERNGLMLDEPTAHLRLAETEARITQIEDGLLEHVSEELRERYCLKHYKRQPPRPVRPSWAPTSKFFQAFMEESGAPIFERTPAGKPSWSAGVMQRLARDYPFVDAILEHRGLVKDTGYLRSWIAKTVDGRLHPTLKPAHVTTGRLSSENPNAQQVSRHLKSAFVAPEGWAFLQADYAQIELRIAAQLAHEERMIEAFLRGEDLHRVMASTIVSRPPEFVTKDERQNAKAANFGFLYGMGAQKFVDYARDEYGLFYSLEDAQELRYLFFQTWPRLESWHEEQRLTAHTHGYVRSPLGRRRRLPDLQSNLGGKVAAAERQAVNAPVQSFASDLMLLALIELDRHPSPYRRVVGTVHDSLLAEVRKDHLTSELSRIGAAMLYPRTRELFGVEMAVPLEVEFLLGHSWGDPEPRVAVVSTNPQPLLDG